MILVISPIVVSVFGEEDFLFSKINALPTHGTKISEGFVDIGA